MFVDAIKNFVTSRTERFRALYKNPSRFLLATSDFRLYELLKNDSRFLRITDANAPLLAGTRLRQQSRWIMAAHSVRRARNSRFSQDCFACLVIGWWRMTGSNRRPPACKAGALPAELIPQALSSSSVQFRLGGSPSSWWVWLDSNQRPPPYQDGALTD